MSNYFDISSLEWKSVRPEITNGVFGKAMLDGNIKAVLTRVEPGGKFKMHADKYAHLFYFLSGEGSVWVGDKRSGRFASGFAQPTCLTSIRWSPSC